LIVSLNLLCPVSLESGPGSVAINRASAMEELARVDVGLLTPALSPFPATGILLELEAVLRDRSNTQPVDSDYVELAAAQWMVYGIAEPEEAEPALHAHVARWQDLLRFPEFSAEARADVTQVLSAVTPLLRIENAHLGPRQLPLFLLATYIYGLLSRELGAKTTPKRLGQIARDLSPLLLSISHLGDRPWLPDEEVLFEKDSVPSPFERSASKALALLHANRRAGLTWSEILVRSGATTLHDTLDLLTLFALSSERVRFLDT
jgi:hypothetical protein